MLLDVNPVHKVMFSSVSRSSREGIPPSAPRPRNPAHSSPRQWVKEEEEAVAAQYAINILRPKHDATTRERKEERTSRMASQRTPRVTQAVHSPPIPESPQTPAAKVVNALKGKADSSIKRSPQVAKLRENVECLPHCLSIKIADVVSWCKSRILCCSSYAIVQWTIASVVNSVLWNGYCRRQLLTLQLDGSEIGFHQLYPRHRSVQRKRQ
jgi:hypothetical protein